MGIIDLLKLPEAKKIDKLDSPGTSEIHREIIQKKLFLKKLYLDFYERFVKSLISLPQGLLVEIGSGSGFLKEVIPDVITTDLFDSPNIDIVLNGNDLPFNNNSVSAFFLLNVLHHIKDTEFFLSEFNRCLVDKGKVIMIEPYNSLFSSFVYKNFHHEPFNPKAGWKILEEGRLSGANGALPWIIFFRDRLLYEKMFPNLKIKEFKPHTPFSYLLSGGLSMRQLVPTFTYDSIRLIEKILSPLNQHLAMFVTIELEKCL